MSEEQTLLQNEKCSYDQIPPDQIIDEQNKNIKYKKTDSRTVYFTRYEVFIKNDNGKWKLQSYEKSLCHIEYFNHDKIQFIKRQDKSTGAEINHMLTHIKDVEDQKDKEAFQKKKNEIQQKRQKQSQKKQNQDNQQLTIEQVYQQQSPDTIINKLWQKINKDVLLKLYKKYLFLENLSYIKGLQPPSQVDRQGYSNILDNFCPLFNIPSRTKNQKILKFLYNIAYQQVKSKLQKYKIQSFGVTHDASTFANKSMLMINIGFIPQQWNKYQNVFLALQEQEFGCNSAYLSNQVSQTLHQFDLIEENDFQIQEINTIDQTLNESVSEGSDDDQSLYDPNEDSNYDSSQSSEDNDQELDMQENDSYQIKEQEVGKEEKQEEEQEEEEFFDDENNKVFDQEQYEALVKQDQETMDEYDTEDENIYDTLQKYLFQGINFQNEFENLTNDPNKYANPIKISSQAVDGALYNIDSQKYMPFSNCYIIDILHMINNSLQTTVKQIDELMDIFGKLSKIIAHIRRSNKSKKAMERVHQLQQKKLNKDHQYSLLQMESDCQTRFIQKYKQIKAFIRNYSSIKKLFNKNFPVLKQNKINKNELDILKQIQPIFEMLHETLQFFQSDNSRISYVLPAFYTTINDLEILQNDQEIVKLIKKKLKVQLFIRFHKYIFQQPKTLELLAKATFLDPSVSYLNLYVNNKFLYEQVKDKIKWDILIYHLFYNEDSVKQESQNQTSDQNEQTQNVVYNNRFCKKKIKIEEQDNNEEVEMYTSGFQQKKCTLLTRIENQLAEYEIVCKMFDVNVKQQKPPYNLNIDNYFQVPNPTETWQNFQKEKLYNLINVLARVYLSQLGSSIINEKIFSSVTYTMNKYRQKTKTQTLNSLIFIKINLKNEILSEKELQDTFIQEVKVKNCLKK